jgi:hypothetical protein
MALRRPPALDAVLAAALTVLLQLELWLGETYKGDPAFPGDRAVTAVLLLGVTVPLAWRRVHPRAAFAASMLALSVLSLWLGGAEAGGLFLVLLIAVYSAAAWSDRPLEVVAIAAVTLIAHELRNPWSQGLGDYVFAPASARRGSCSAASSTPAGGGLSRLRPPPPRPSPPSGRGSRASCTTSSPTA